MNEAMGEPEDGGGSSGSPAGEDLAGEGPVGEGPVGEGPVGEGPVGGGPVVLDASAVLALLYGEPGQEEIRRRIRGREVVIGAVNVSEVAAKLAGAGFTAEECRLSVDALAPVVEAFDEGLAYAAGETGPATRERGLSLGDRACLALANSLGASALTTDTAWDGLEGAEVIRR